MAVSPELKERIAAFARELAAELGEVDDSDALSWLDAIESQAVEIGDAISTELLERRAAALSTSDKESTCPQCSQPGRYHGQRQRELIGRRGPATIGEPEYYCPACRRAFFPAPRAIGVEVDCPFTPALLRKVAHAGAQQPSFVVATRDLAVLAEQTVSRQRVQRWTKRVGNECVQDARALADAYQALPLPEQQKSPAAQVPQVACVMMDGGRIQVRAVARRADELGGAPDGDETSPAAIVAKTLGYLRNQQRRMTYDEYRRLRLPITSSHIESTIKQINRRMKGTEKLWDQGAQPLLQLVAGGLSETDRLDRFWRNRRKRLQPMRCYQAAA